nr:hypothetical protein [Rubripirellula sp.]
MRLGVTAYRITAYRITAYRITACSVTGHRKPNADPRRGQLAHHHSMNHSSLFSGNASKNGPRSGCKTRSVDYPV